MWLFFRALLPKHLPAAAGNDGMRAARINQNSNIKGQIDNVLKDTIKLHRGEGNCRVMGSTLQGTSFT